jgi:hypothetical protein
MRKVIAIIDVDDDKAINRGVGTIEFLEQELGLLMHRGVYLQDARILDEDDGYDTKAIELANKIFEEEN